MEERLEKEEAGELGLEDEEMGLASGGGGVTGSGLWLPSREVKEGATGAAARR